MAWCGIAKMWEQLYCLQAGVHPEQPGHSVTRAEFESLWAHSVELLRRGFATGSILTVDEAEAAVLGKPWTRRCASRQDALIFGLGCKKVHHRAYCCSPGPMPFSCNAVEKPSGYVKDVSMINRRRLGNSSGTFTTRRGAGVASQRFAPG